MMITIMLLSIAYIHLNKVILPVCVTCSSYLFILPGLLTYVANLLVYLCALPLSSCWNMPAENAFQSHNGGAQMSVKARIK